MYPLAWNKRNVSQILAIDSNVLIDRLQHPLPVLVVHQVAIHPFPRILEQFCVRLRFH